jgi:hypothetical protein
MPRVAKPDKRRVSVSIALLPEAHARAVRVAEARDTTVSALLAGVIEKQARRWAPLETSVEVSQVA